MKPIGNGKIIKRDGDKMGFPVLLGGNREEGTMGYRERIFFP
jgi:glutamyl-tRNA synthetase